MKRQSLTRAIIPTRPVWSYYCFVFFYSVLKCRTGRYRLFLEDEKNVLSKQISVILDKFNIKNNIVNIHDPVANILDMIDINKITITPGQIYFLRNDLTGTVMRTVARSINGFVVGGLSLTDLVLYRSPVMGIFCRLKI